MSQHSPKGIFGLIGLALMYLRSKITVKVLITFSMLSMFYLGRLSVPAYKTEFHHFTFGMNKGKLEVYVDDMKFIEDESINLFEQDYMIGFSLRLGHERSFIQDMFLVEAKTQVLKLKDK